MHCARVASRRFGDFESAHTCLFLIRVGRRVARSAVFHKRLAGSSRSRPSGVTAMRRRHTKSQIDTPIIKAADVHQVRPPVAEQPDRGRKHDGRRSCRADCAAIADD